MTIGVYEELDSIQPRKSIEHPVEISWCHATDQLALIFVTFSL